jgi:hypothetical protein
LPEFLQSGCGKRQERAWKLIEQTMGWRARA